MITGLLALPVLAVVVAWIVLGRRRNKRADVSMLAAAALAIVPMLVTKDFDLNPPWEG